MCYYAMCAYMYREIQPIYKYNCLTAYKSVSSSENLE